MRFHYLKTFHFRVREKMTEKTHYRKVFKSDHLGVADLEDFIESGHNLIFTIAYVRQEYDVRVAGKKGNFNIAYFKEGIKPLVLNAGNSKVMKNLSGHSSFVDDWQNIAVRLYIDPSVQFGRDIVSGVRISHDAPVSRQSLEPNTKAWDNAKAAYARDKNLDAVKKRMDISPEIEKQLIGEVNAVS